MIQIYTSNKRAKGLMGKLLKSLSYLKINIIKLLLWIPLSIRIWQGINIAIKDMDLFYIEDKKLLYYLKNLI